MIQNRNFLILLLVLALPLLSISGCTTLVDFPIHNVEFPPTKEINLDVELQLSDELRKAQWETQSGDKIIVPIGETLSYDCEKLARSIFSKVIVQEDLSEGTADRSIVELTPRIMRIKHTRPMFSFGDQQTTLIFEWVMKDYTGNIIWLKTIDVQVKSIMGSFDSPARSKEHVEMLIDRLFEISYAEITSSQEILLCAKKVANER